MVFYDENNKRVSYDTSNPIGGEQYGYIFKISEEECLKVYKRGQVVDDNILKFIRELNLKRFYELHTFLYGRTHKFRAHTMKYYKAEEIDILTMPIDYTLYSLYDLFESFGILTEKNIFANDTHTGNVIINSDGLIVIDTDLYTFNKFYSQSRLKTSNYSALRYLFTEIYLEALKKYHSGLSSFNNKEAINELFNSIIYGDINSTHKKLSRCKYPIDYISKYGNKWI